MLSHHHKPIVHEHGISGYDTKDVVGKRLAVSFTILSLATVLCAVVALWAWKRWEVKQSSGSVAVLPVAEERTLPALPRLQPMPKVDIEALRAEEASKLKSYAWIDKQAQIVQIPIDRAIDLLANKNLPHGREAHIPGQGQLAAPSTVTSK